VRGGCLVIDRLRNIFLMRHLPRNVYFSVKRYHSDWRPRSGMPRLALIRRPQPHPRCCAILLSFKLRLYDPNARSSPLPPCLLTGAAAGAFLGVAPSYAIDNWHVLGTAISLPSRWLSTIPLLWERHVTREST
jgi:hypothetical protein